jgi:hypothetical protein
METNIALLSILIVASAASKGQTNAKAIDAYLKYTGADISMDKTLKNIQQSTNKEAQTYLGAGFYLTKTIIDKKITFIYRFP